MNNTFTREKCCCTNRIGQQRRDWSKPFSCNGHVVETNASRINLIIQVLVSITLLMNQEDLIIVPLTKCVDTAAFVPRKSVIDRSTDSTDATAFFFRVRLENPTSRVRTVLQVEEHAATKLSHGKKNYEWRLIYLNDTLRSFQPRSSARGKSSTLSRRHSPLLLRPPNGPSYRAIRSYLSKL